MITLYHIDSWSSLLIATFFNYRSSSRYIVRTVMPGKFKA